MDGTNSGHGEVGIRVPVRCYMECNTHEHYLRPLYPLQNFISLRIKDNRVGILLINREGNDWWFLSVKLTLQKSPACLVSTDIASTQILLYFIPVLH